MRFALMNIQGLITKRNDKLKSKELKQVFDTNDIICIMESWGDESQNFDYEGFEHYELHRTENKTCRRNSGGILVYIRDKFVSNDILVMKCNDTHIWFKLKSDFFNFENDLYLCICYFPPSNSSRQGIIDTNAYDVLLENIIHFQDVTNERCNFMIVGDLNSRIGLQYDYSLTIVFSLYVKQP